MHPNLVSQVREIEIFWTANWPPLKVFAGAFGLVFVSICHIMLALFCGFFHCFRLFGGFFEANWFLTLIAFDKKDNAVPMQKTNYIIAKHVYTRRFLRDHLFLGVFILDRAWPVWSGCEMVCFC